jgi:hypothetical protein
VNGLSQGIAEGSAIPALFEMGLDQALRGRVNASVEVI